MQSQKKVEELAKELELLVDTIFRYTGHKENTVIKMGEKQYRYELKTVLADS